jgi:DNA-binding MarR family transcriptional regulator
LIHYEHVILFILAKANQRVHGIFKGRLQPFGLTPMQGLILHALYEEDGLFAGEIGRRLQLDSATLSGVLERMTEAGWIEKQTDSDDRRLVHINLTDKALSLRDEFTKEIETINNGVMASFRMEERLLLERMLKDLKG